MQLFGAKCNIVHLETEGSSKEKTQKRNKGHVKHVSVSSWPLFHRVGWMFTRMGVFLKLD